MKPEKNPQGPREGMHRVFRGGSGFSSAENCRAAHRSGHAPVNCYDHVGLRVVMVAKRKKP